MPIQVQIFYVMLYCIIANILNIIFFKNDRKSYRFIINLVVGSVVMIGVLLSLIIFVVVPQLEARHKFDPVSFFKNL